MLTANKTWLAVVTVCSCLRVIATCPAETIEFNRDIRPILSDNCFYCHGPDAGHRQADLRLDNRESAVATGAITAGNAATSLLVKRILSEDNTERMPPPDSHKQLSPAQKQLLQQWIDQGATYQRHWSYEPPVKPAIPEGMHAIDYLVGKQLAKVDLTASPQADARTLIRRLYWDLIGLPPSPQEAADFQQAMTRDATGAYDQLVDRLLGSEHFGERMAINWLDTVRFADTIGYHSDNPREVWPYRDWVIQSFNSNKRFDRFTLEQIAGDLLPDANQETRLGSAFNRLLLSTEEGGAQPKDYEARMLTDRVRAIGSAWMGQTTGCAQCHDHKFDPFTSRDFYSLGAFFADIEEPIVGRREAGMPVANPLQEEQLQLLAQRRDQAKKAFDQVADLLNTAQQSWEQALTAGEISLPELAADSTASEADRQLAQQVQRDLAAQVADRKPAQLQNIQKYFQLRGPHDYAAVVVERDASEQAYADALAKLPTCLVSKSAKTKRVVRILPRGNWMDESGEVVQAAFPHYLPQPQIQGRELTRLDLAQWLVARDNPLTARNFVNRLWKQFFGAGLSRVLDDLGAQGEPPVNAALLDWLACEFMDSGWDIKHMIRLIVRSTTYQQVSTATEKHLAVDPNNRFCARQSAFRLEAELIRDNALQIAGLLTQDIGGPSFKPYQPERYWENLNFPQRDYVADGGPTQYRRGLYAWWQRSFLHPSLLAFDAPSREECIAERSRSNIPQQALVLLNDPTYVEASRAFASRVLSETGLPDADHDPVPRLRFAFRLALQRDPTEQEVDVLQRLLERQWDQRRADGDSARPFLAVGNLPRPAALDDAELAAWTHVARVLLNLHESITRN